MSMITEFSSDLYVKYSFQKMLSADTSVKAIQGSLFFCLEKESLLQRRGKILLFWGRFQTTTTINTKCSKFSQDCMSLHIIGDNLLETVERYYYKHNLLE